MKKMKMYVGAIIIALAITNLSGICTLGLKGIDKVGSGLGFCTVDIVNYGSEFIYTLEDLGL